MSRASASIAILIAAVAGFLAGRMTAGEGGSEVPLAAEGGAAGNAQGLRVLFRRNAPSKGPEDALVTIVEFSEFQ